MIDLLSWAVFSAIILMAMSPAVAQRAVPLPESFCPSFRAVICLGNKNWVDVIALVYGMLVTLGLLAGLAICLWLVVVIITLSIVG